MSNIDIFILAIALSIDACVVSFSNGLVFTQNKRLNSLILAFSVGFFQFLMPIIGFLGAKSINQYVKPYDFWIVFIIFLLLGIKFIKDAFKKDKEEKINCYFCFRYIFFVSVATSIDALGAGISIAFTGEKILLPAIIIGVVTFFNSLFGFWMGNLFQKLPTKNLEIFSGLILIGLAFKILFENI
jgi:putative Mn2+ efflux pump MntP